MRHCNVCSSIAWILPNEYYCRSRGQICLVSVSQPAQLLRSPLGECHFRRWRCLLIPSFHQRHCLAILTVWCVFHMVRNCPRAAVQSSISTLCLVHITYLVL